MGKRKKSRVSREDEEVELEGEEERHEDQTDDETTNQPSGDEKSLYEVLQFRLLPVWLMFSGVCLI